MNSHTPIPKESWKWFGSPGHFCVCHRCQFHLCTQVGNYLVSTVGDYLPEGAESFKPVNSSGLFETMVFAVSGPCPCGCGAPDHNGRELEVQSYNTRKEANEGHVTMCERAALWPEPPQIPYLDEP